MTRSTHPKIQRFCERFGLQAPILLAPMAGLSPPALSIAVMQAGGMGACGALLMSPAAIADWATAVRTQHSGPFNMNLWIPDPAPVRDRAHEQRLRDFLGHWGPALGPDAGDATPPDFQAQCEAMLAVRPAVISSVMGLYPPDFVAALKAAGMTWFANVSTVTEALAAQAAGAEVIVAQGMEAGGHRGCFDAQQAESQLVGLFALLPAIVDAVTLPVVATGGIADARGIAAAIALGASAVQIGSGFMRCPEAQLPGAWAAAMAHAKPEDTVLTRAFSGRAGRSLITEYVRASQADNAPQPAPYPVQRSLTRAMREAAIQHNTLAGMQAWAGQASYLAQAKPAQQHLTELWADAQRLMP
ncbi:NAD(P)H-dependent flavin oxidoreductase [Parvibium lacunae]|uniref:Propionate 3-nitronate monooxygenase n=1 Tax=Parvibium lacunae TaxID=1888893 RepID=A0A368KZR3_9BURK|nr:nitronate monooxygenase [Parvibium lacunae]RCS56800.1 nitronate monooxygenase [Parvibium lacunae]